MSKRTVVVRLTPEEADLIWRNADGWSDAGACEGGLTEAEHEALGELQDQISRQIHKRQRQAAKARRAGAE